MMKKLHFQGKRKRENEAANLASDILDANALLAFPIDPFAVATAETRGLRLIGANLQAQCDGQLEYHRDQDLFILFYNTRYDEGLPEGVHHPRTRFSVAHELGHFFLEHHRSYLMQGGRGHTSSGEFSSEVLVEREADAFAAGLLMPSPLLRPVVNQGELSLDRIREIADKFKTSFVSTAIRSVQHSDFPCEVVGIRDGAIAWRFRRDGQPDPLTEGKCYRLPNGPITSPTARRKWEEFLLGHCNEECLQGKPHDWFNMYGSADRDITVWEHYLPVPIMSTLVILLTVSETELFDLSSY